MDRTELRRNKEMVMEAGNQSQGDHGNWDLRGFENGFLGTENRKRRKTIGLWNGIQAYLRARVACDLWEWLNWKARHQPFLHSSHSSPFINSQFYAHTAGMHSLLQSGTKVKN